MISPISSISSTYLSNFSTSLTSKPSFGKKLQKDCYVKGDTLSNKEKYEFTKDELKTIKTISNCRKDKGLNKAKIDPNALLDIIAKYDNIEKLHINEQLKLLSKHNQDKNVYPPGILKKSDAEHISEDSSLLRFNYIRDLMESENDQRFCSKIKNKIPEYKDIKHPLLIRYIKNLSNNQTDMQECRELMDAINSANGKYTPLNYCRYTGGKSVYGRFDSFMKHSYGSGINKVYKTMKAPERIDKYLKSKGITMEEFIKDIEINAKYGPLQDYVYEKNNADDINGVLYKEYYLKNIQKDIDVSLKVVEKCRNIYEKHKVMIFLSAHKDSIDESLEYIDKELSAWEKASEGRAIMPIFINFNTTKDEWYKKNPTVAYAQNGKTINFPCINLSNIKYALRHEMTHINDERRRMYVYGREKAFNEVVDRKYADEFWLAGIKPEEIEYAYQNPNEYLAVAMEGNTKFYSEKHKNLLCEMGLPEWAFDLEYEE